MKKLCACLLILALLLPTLTALAQADQPLLFQKLKWGTTYDQTVDAMIKQKIIKGKGRPTFYLGPDAPIQVLACSPFPGLTSLSGIKEEVLGWASRSDMKVAGYDAWQADFYFAPKADKNGKYKLNQKNYVFFMADYRIQADDHEAVFDDLWTKLSKLYGEPDLMDVYKDPYVEYQAPYAQWFGAEDTTVILCGGSNLRISYAWLGGEKLLEKAVRHYGGQMPTPTPRPDDLEGL